MCATIEPGHGGRGTQEYQCKVRRVLNWEQSRQCIGQRMTGIDLDQHRFPVKCHQPCPILSLTRSASLHPCLSFSRPIPFTLGLSLSLSPSLLLPLAPRLALYSAPSCLFTARLFLVYNPGRVCTRFHGQRENYYPATLLRYLPCFLITIGAAAPTICVSRQPSVREPSVNVVPITMPAPSAKTLLIV